MGAPRSNRLRSPASTQRSTIDCLTADEAFAYVAGSAIAPRAIEVQAHLDECEMCRIVVGEAARARTESKAAAENRAPNSRRRTLSPGELIADRYQVIRFVACGGMGEVYEALDTTRDEVVALKTLVLTALDDTRAIARLRREVKLARSVKHPNVCRILEFGEHRPPTTGESIPFLTMEFLRGETLAERIAREGRLPSAAAAYVLEQILAGVGAVHAAGIVHRDIKPQNILILQGSPERVVVMDFGLARALRLTRSAITGSLVVGTADYMAPEQVQGVPANPRFDVYALGVVIFEMLTGRKPFIGDTIEDARARLAGQAAPRPSEVLPELGPTWDDIAAGCLAYQPERRFAGVDEIAAKLREQVLGTPSAKRHTRWATDALAVAGAIALLGSALYLKQAFRKHGLPNLGDSSPATTDPSPVELTRGPTDRMPPTTPLAFPPTATPLGSPSPAPQTPNASTTTEDPASSSQPPTAVAAALDSAIKPSAKPPRRARPRAEQVDSPPANKPGGSDPSQLGSASLDPEQPHKRNPFEERK